VDVYHKELSFFNGISYDIAKLHTRNVRCSDFLPRVCPFYTLGRSITYYGRLCACGKIKRIKNQEYEKVTVFYSVAVFSIKRFSTKNAEGEWCSTGKDDKRYKYHSCQHKDNTK
jgi:hypothetical protein